MVWLEGPVLPNDGVTEVAYFLQHGVHEGRAQLGGVVFLALPLFRLDVLCRSRVVVEGWADVQKLTASLHVPAGKKKMHTHTVCEATDKLLKSESCFPYIVTAIQNQKQVSSLASHCHWLCRSKQFGAVHVYKSFVF